FDDGPSRATDQIIDVLEHHGVKATFFMLEPAMKEHAESVKRLADHGHAVGLHGMTHDQNLFYQSEQSALDEMLTSQKTLKEITGVNSSLVRTPYGSIPFMTES